MRKGLCTIHKIKKKKKRKETVATSMVNSDKCKTKGKQNVHEKKSMSEKPEKQKASWRKHFSQHKTNKARAVRPPITPTPMQGKKSLKKKHKKIPGKANALPLLKVKYFCCLSAFKRNSDGLESSNRPGPDSLASLETFSPASPAPPAPPAPPPSLWASLPSFCWVSAVSGSRN